MITYPTIEDAIAVSPAERPGPVLVRYTTAGHYEWLADLDVNELLSYGYDDEFEIIEVES